MHKSNQRQRWPAVCSVSFALLKWLCTAYCTLHTTHCKFYKILNIKPNCLQSKQHCSDMFETNAQMHNAVTWYTMYDKSGQLLLIPTASWTLHIAPLSTFQDFNMFEVSPYLFLVSAENGAGVNKMTNIMFAMVVPYHVWVSHIRTKQAHKARRCDSNLQSETINHWPTDWLTDRGRC